VNASRLQHIIQHPESIDAQTALDLQAIASDLPWFSTPRTLLARYYKSKNDYRETDSLHHAALRVQDRRWLFHYLNEIPAVTKASAPAEVQAATREPAPPTTQPAAKEEKKAQASSSKPHFEPVASNQDVNAEIPNDSPLFLSEDNEARIEAAVHSAFSFAPAEPEHPNRLDKQSITYDLEDQFESERPEPQDFFAWLKQAQAGETESKEETETPIAPAIAKEEDPEIEETNSQDLGPFEVPDYNLDHLNLREDTKPEEPKFLDLAARQALIDKFISTNPSISRPKKEFYNPEVAMKRAEEFDASICSETLAGLFRKQQAWDKALACYSRLQLKFPEKSAYFAALITEVENEKRNHES
jgi:hypothetical protein